MCLISVAPKGTHKYSEMFIKALITGGESNTDGAGYMFKRASNKKVYISKGYNNTEGLIKSLRSHRLKDNDELVVHQRIGNKGAKNTDMCHPFVLSDDKDIILSNDQYVDFPVLCHNGTFTQHSEWNSNFSDTYFFVKDFMYRPELIELMKNDLSFFKTIFNIRLGTNRLCFLFPHIDQDYIKIGDWKTDEGYVFSNETYKNSKIKNVGGSNYATPYYGQGSYYDEDEWEDFRTVVNGGHGAESNISDAVIIEDDTDEDDVTSEENRWLKKGQTPGFQNTLPFRDNQGYHKPNLMIGEIMINSGTAVQCESTGITYRLYMDMWIGEKYNESSQFEAIRWNPTIFNFDDFTYKALENDPVLGIIKNTYYKIINFDNNKGTKIHILNRRWPLKNVKERPIYISEPRLVALFSSMVNAELRDKYKGYYNLCKTVQSSKNTLKKIVNIMGGTKYKTKATVGFKGLICPTESIQLYYLLLMKHISGASYLTDISKAQVVLL